jgi:hypothetical protein
MSRTSWTNFEHGRTVVYHGANPRRASWRRRTLTGVSMLPWRNGGCQIDFDYGGIVRGRYLHRPLLSCLRVYALARRRILRAAS